MVLLGFAFTQCICKNALLLPLVIAHIVIKVLVRDDNVLWCLPLSLPGYNSIITNWSHDVSALMPLGSGDECGFDWGFGPYHAILNHKNVKLADTKIHCLYGQRLVPCFHRECFQIENPARRSQVLSTTEERYFAFASYALYSSWNMRCWWWHVPFKDSTYHTTMIWYSWIDESAWDHSKSHRALNVSRHPLDKWSVGDGNTSCVPYPI